MAIQYSPGSAQAELVRLTESIAMLEEQRALVVARLRKPSDWSGEPMSWRQVGELAGMSHEAARRRWSDLGSPTS